MIPSVLLAESFQLRSLCSSHKIIFLFEYMNFLKLVQAVPFWIGCMHWSVQKNLDTSLHGYIYIYIYIYIYTNLPATRSHDKQNHNYDTDSWHGVPTPPPLPLYSMKTPYVYPSPILILLNLQLECSFYFLVSLDEWVIAPYVMLFYLMILWIYTYQALEP